MDNSAKDQGKNCGVKDSKSMWIT